MISVILFALLAFSTGAVSLFGRNSLIRSISFTLLVLSTIALIWFSMGKPRAALFGIENNSVVIAYTLDEPHAIYLWLQPPNAKTPIAVSLPWKERLANNLVKANRISEAKHGKLVISNKGVGQYGERLDLGVAPSFHVVSPPEFPPKRSMR